MQSKTRLDKFLVERGYCRSRHQAQEIILQGLVEINHGSQWSVCQKVSTPVDHTTQIKIAENPLQKYVSRAALKLMGALEKNPVDLSNGRCLDIGQSTGGFTQVLLEKGASEVVGVEVGHGQLASPLRDNPRVLCLEGINARELTKALAARAAANGGKTLSPNAIALTKPFGFAVMDVSFISQTLIVPEIKKVLTATGKIFALVKPQFESAPSGLNSPDLNSSDLSTLGLKKSGGGNRSRLPGQIKAMILACYTDNGFKVLDYFPSQIKGSEGNQEFFVYAEVLKTSS